MTARPPPPAAEARRRHFLHDVVETDLATGRQTRVVTRFPPEPNGFLHIGHAKSICLNFGLAREYGGVCHLRMDDTNPTTEEVRYVEAIEHDVHWLGFQWAGEVRYASDYFERMYECAERLVRAGKAYVDSQSVEEIRQNRGSFERPGVDSPYRTRTAAENLELFHAMRAGQYADGQHVLRAKIDMAHPNLLMRDPLLYRIRHASHHRTGSRWCIYPMYDYAHPLEDAFEGVTHSICTLEFESNRELYDWVLDALGPWNPRPRQYEFARLALGFTLMSKRKLLQLVEERRVSGWDDPRMPTIAGMRRRGVPPEALRDFADLIGVAKNNSIVDIGKLEFCIRQDLERRAPRAMAVLRPLPVVVTNWPADEVEDIELPWWPGEPERAGHRKVPFGRDLVIEREDFAEEPPAGWKRLAPGREVRLVGAYFLRCDAVVRDPATGEVAEVHCSYDPATRGGVAPDGRSPQGTLHWLSLHGSAPVTVRLYDRLFTAEQPEAEGAGDFHQFLNPDSLVACSEARVEPALAEAEPGAHFQFVRQGYFFSDPVDSQPGAPVFNRVIGLRDTWGKATGRVRDEGRPERRRADNRAETEPRSAARKTRADGRAELRAADPELAARYERYQRELGLDAADADILTGSQDLARFFDAAVAAHGQAKSVARWAVNDLLSLVKDRSLATSPMDGAGFGVFVALVDAGRITTVAARQLLAHLVEQGGDPDRLVDELGLARTDDAGSIGRAVEETLAGHPEEVARYRAGEHKLLGVLIGAVMRAMGGKADAAAVRAAVLERLR